MNSPNKPTISFKDLEKIGIRVGTIEEVQDVEKSDKLIRIRVDLGDRTRTVFSGMKKERNSRELVGRQALFVVNLG